MRALLSGVGVAAALIGCGPAVVRTPAKADDAKLDLPVPWIDPESFQVAGAEPTLRPLADATKNAAAPTIAIVGGTVMTASGKVIERGTVVLAGGAITAVGGADVAVPAGARVIDARGRFVTHAIGLTRARARAADHQRNDSATARGPRLAETSCCAAVVERRCR